MSAKQTADEIRLDGKGLRFGEVMDVARFGARVALTGAAVARMEESARIVERLGNSDEPVYGVSTGFGSLATTSIPADRREQLQLSLIRSHAAGMGEPVEAEVVRGLMLMRARSLAMARSGARPVVAETLLALLNSGLSPVVPEYGSLGASGDLAPLAHCALVLIGEGEVLGPGGSRIPSGEALRSAGIEPLKLRSKEGLALINGTDGILGMLVLAICDLERTLRTADIAAAASVEALLGTDRAFAADLVGLRAEGPSGALIGEVSGLHVGAAQDLLAVRLADGREALVPFVEAIVPVVDVADGRVVIDAPPGLLELAE